MKLLGLKLLRDGFVDNFWAGTTEDSREKLKEQLENVYRTVMGVDHIGDLTQNIESDIIINALGVYVDDNDNMYYVHKFASDNLRVVANKLTQIDETTFRKDGTYNFFVNGESFLSSRNVTLTKYIGDIYEY